MPAPISPARRLSDELLTVALCADELERHTAPRVPLPALTAADQRTLRRLFARCQEVRRAARDAQAALAPYLRERAA